ncbi:MAG: sarcosine oxidase subunit gamma [Roseobacter sp.]
MSEPVTALNGASFDGGIALVKEVPLQGMITLRGDLMSQAVHAAATIAMPGDMPGPGTARIEGENGVAWMSPDEALILCAYDVVPEVLGEMHGVLQKSHALAVNVSDARASFRVCGPHARDVVAKLCPVDLAPAVFVQGMFRRTRMAQVPAALWLCADDAFQVICFRSQARYVFDLLSIAAQKGSEVDLLTEYPHR